MLNQNRRDFMKLAGGSAFALLAARLPAMAGPFTAADFRNLVPVDKKLRPEWVKSLFERGRPEVFAGVELRHIGMPVGGIACGQLYLGGDGRLWYWDLFHSRTSSDNNLGVHYANPMVPDDKLPHGFAVKIKRPAGAPLIRPLRQDGFGRVSFRGEYPVGRITYADAAVPLEVRLTAYSPFIPLNLDDSALPATILSYTLKNTGATPLEVELAGWVSNAIPVVTPHPGAKGKGKKKAAPPPPADAHASRRNRIEAQNGFTAVVLTAGAAAAGDRGGAESLALSILGQGSVKACADVGTAASPEKIFEALGRTAQPADAHSAGVPITGAVGTALPLKPGEEQTVHFLLTWFFPAYKNPDMPMARIIDIDKLQRRYAARFSNATAVAAYLAANFDRLSGDTLRWNATWYDSSLPYWFLDRTFLTIDCLATQTLHWFDSGRFWAWEGVDCCPGTCQHVWNYAQGPGRIFPQFERDMRERVDFGLAWHPNGATNYRGENAAKVAHDGHLGTILRVYREHLMSRDAQFLKRIWPRVKQSIEFALSWDPDGDGLLEGEQMNTCDAAWYGAMGWISSLFVAALRSGEAMALEMGDARFAERCRKTADRGSQELVKQLFNGEYFIHKLDPAHPEATNTNIGCHIDQSMGQALALQLNLPRVTPAKETRTALESMWKYKFTPDAGGYHEKMMNLTGARKRRWYAMAGEAGMIMTSFPKGGADKAAGKGGFAHYFSEAWTGQEHQVAAHMIWEGLVEQGLAVTRAVHDRHHAALRNPYNEVECSYHYSRAMSSYGSFLAICGFEYHGPKGHIGFAPRLKPEDFKCAFTAAEGWGAFSQKEESGKWKAQIEVKWGKLRVQTIALAVAQQPAGVQVTIAGQAAKARQAFDNGRLLITLDAAATLAAGQTMDVQIG